MQGSKVIETFGESVQIIAEELMKNEELCKLLFYADGPLDGKPNVVDKYRNIMDSHIIINTEVPLGGSEGSYILITVNAFDRNATNTETMDVEIYVDILTPTNEWRYGRPGLRSFAIAGMVTEAFENIDLKGVGRLHFEGGSLAVTGDSLSGYTLRFVNYVLGT